VERHVVPFLCEVCGSPFHELAGGRCSGCGKMVCREHVHVEHLDVSMSPSACMCSKCASEPGQADHERA
jgi:hypothetical protein